MYLISQYGKNDCAFTCLSMMLANYHKDKNYLYLKHEDRPYNFKELIAYAKKENMELVGVRITDTNELLKNHKWPIVVLLKGEKRVNHAALLLKVNKKYVYYFDPCFGKRKVPISDFVLRWTRLALITTDNLMKKRCKQTMIIEPIKKDKRILLFFQVVSGLSLLIGTYFLDGKKPLYVSLICFGLFAIFELIFRRYLITALNHIDDEIYKMKIVKPTEGYAPVYETIQKYRYNVLTTLPNLAYGLMISVFIIVVLGLNNFWNLTFIVASFALSLIESFVIKPTFKDKASEIMEDESKIYASENDYQFQFFARKTSEKANKVALNRVLFKYCEIGILIVFSYLMMKFTGIQNITYVLFNLCISLFLINIFNGVFDYATQKDEFDFIKLKLNNYLETPDANKIYM
ncbi:MAG: cysteine peptidase family C39 domain-containing protein [Bacilli bacterium]|nr:cysteine peptidase family C39 domain-containing protein [Bacilli bacterium]